MRELKTSDIFAGARLLSSIDCKDDIKELVLNRKTNDERSFGFDVLYIIFVKASQVKSEIALYNFIAPIMECKPEEIPEMDPVELLDCLEQIASEEKWKAFFTRVVSLIQKN